MTGPNMPASRRCRDEVSALRPAPGQEFIDPGDRVIVGDAGEDVGEINLWVDAVQLAGLD